MGENVMETADGGADAFVNFDYEPSYVLQRWQTDSPACSGF